MTDSEQDWLDRVFLFLGEAGAISQAAELLRSTDKRAWFDRFVAETAAELAGIEQAVKSSVEPPRDVRRAAERKHGRGAILGWIGHKPITQAKLDVFRRQAAYVATWRWGEVP